MALVGWRIVPVALAGGLAATVLAPLLIEYYTLSIMVIYGLLALSLGLIWGFGGILCFGQSAFYGLGAYTYAICAVNMGESTWPFLLGILVPALVAAAIGAMMFYGRLSDVYLGVITLVVTLILFKFMNSTAGPEYTIGTARLGGFNGIPGFPTLNLPGYPDILILDGAFYYVCCAILLIVYLLVHWFLASSFGRVAVAIRENEQRVELMGYDVRLRKTVLFAIGGAIAGLAGTLYANWAEIVTPSLFSLGQAAEVIIWCIVGGLGTLFGPILGGIALGYVKYLLGQQALIENSLVLGLILVVAVLGLPKGLLPALQKLGGRRGARWGGGRPRRRARRTERRLG